MFQKQEKDRFSFCLYLLVYCCVSHIPFSFALSFSFSFSMHVCLCVRKISERISFLNFYFYISFQIGNCTITHTMTSVVLEFSAIFGWFNEFGVHFVASLRLALFLRHITKQYIEEYDANNCISFEQHFVSYLYFFFLCFNLISMVSFSLDSFLFWPTNIPCNEETIQHTTLAYTKIFSIRYDKWDKKKTSTFLALQFNRLPFDFFPYFLLFLFLEYPEHCVSYCQSSFWLEPYPKCKAYTRTGRERGEKAISR